MAQGLGHKVQGTRVDRSPETVWQAHASCWVCSISERKRPSLFRSHMCLVFTDGTQCALRLQRSMGNGFNTCWTHIFGGPGFLVSQESEVLCRRETLKLKKSVDVSQIRYCASFLLHHIKRGLQSTYLVIRRSSSSTLAGADARSNCQLPSFEQCIAFFHHIESSENQKCEKYVRVAREKTYAEYAIEALA